MQVVRQGGKGSRPECSGTKGGEKESKEKIRTCVTNFVRGGFKKERSGGGIVAAKKEKNKGL